MTLLRPFHAPVRPLKALYDVAAPAKLNLFLHITGRRPDGYHLLQSVFMLIDWCDTLHFELRTDGQISREDLDDSGHADGAAADLPAEDLAVRAAKALQAACGTSLGVHIGLQKRIPSQAGMGGGSSDAASCLLALQRLWGVRLPTQDLHAIALALGADVPFFLSGGHAWVEGIGEKITPLALPPARLWWSNRPPDSRRKVFSARRGSNATQKLLQSKALLQMLKASEISRFRIWPQRLAAGSAGDVPADWPVARLAEKQDIFKGA
jgi:4-diphosphocytidyl-2C-methyl-D-erythritol kinase